MTIVGNKEVRSVLGAKARCIRLLFLTLGFFCAIQPLTAQVANEDATRLCPLISPELAKIVADSIKDEGRCETQCSGCGCKGGPGYRGPDGCVGWKQLIAVCGPPPHDRCARECEPVSAGCPGRAWVKELAAKNGLKVPFLEGKERQKKNRGTEKHSTPQNDDALTDQQSPDAQQVVPGKSKSSNSATFTCAGKRTCREMISCDEAKFYLTSCGVSSLDGDHDGIPCNSLCN